jgi:hypothetical protein
MGDGGSTSVFVSAEWNSSALVKAATKTGKKKNALMPMTFSFAARHRLRTGCSYKIIPRPCRHDRARRPVYVYGVRA